MEKSKLIRKLIICATLGILIMSMMPTVQGAETARIRPIEDWIYGNDPESWDHTDNYAQHTPEWPLFDPTWDDWDKSLTVIGNPFGTWRGFTNIESELIIHFDWLALNDEVEYTGFVLEREMPDGSLKFSVRLLVKNVYIEVYRASGPHWSFIEELVLVGTMDYLFLFDFVLEKEFLGGPIPTTDLYLEPGTREPGYELPNLGDIWYDPDIYGARDVFFQFTGMGSGDLVEPGWLPPFSPIVPDQPEFWWFLPPSNIPVNPPVPTGETAKVKVQQIYTIVPHSPNFFWGWMQPVSTLKIF